MKKLFPILIIMACVSGLRVQVFAQSCTTAVCTAASPAESDVLAALPSSSNTNATVVVNIPAGTAAWAAPLAYTIPSAVTNLTIQGATTVSWSGTAGTSSYAYTVNDNTVIEDAYQANCCSNVLLTITTGKTSAFFRMTGLTIEGGNISNANYAKEPVIAFYGSSQNFRVDHNHINNTTYTPSSAQSAWLRVYGQIEGVLDHNVLDLGNNTTVANGFQAYNAVDDTIGYGDGAWANPTGWGGTKFLFMENNYYNGGAPDDCNYGGRFVMRYNTVNSAYIGVQSHGTKTTEGGYRGCRAFEVYDNYFTGPTSSPASGAVGSKGNSQLIWGNTMAAGAAYRFYESSTDRNSGSEVETNTPNGWGYCGTTVNGNGVGSPWDGNQPATSGYPCLDGLGRGQTAQALNGQYFPNRLISSTSTIAWPQQDLEPIYMWNNSVGSATYVLIQDSITQNNRDYYYDCGSQNSACSGTFTGAAGTGYGLLSARPTNCTPGAGGTYQTSPTGSYGVAYFATDDNSGQGELYACSSTNTWTPIYEPYTYPHPLVSGNPTKAAAPAPPKNLVSTVD